MGDFANARYAGASQASADFAAVCASTSGHHLGAHFPSAHAKTIQARTGLDPGCGVKGGAFPGLYEFKLDEINLFACLETVDKAGAGCHCVYANLDPGKGQELGRVS